MDDKPLSSDPLDNRPCKDTGSSHIEDVSQDLGIMSTVSSDGLDPISHRDAATCSSEESSYSTSSTTDSSTSSYESAIIPEPEMLILPDLELDSPLQEDEDENPVVDTDENLGDLESYKDRLQQSVKRLKRVNNRSRPSGLTIDQLVSVMNYDHGCNISEGDKCHYEQVLDHMVTVEAFKKKDGKFFEAS